MRRLNGPGMNIHLSNLMSELLEPVGGEMVDKAEKGSTENVLNVVDNYNNMVEHEKSRKVCIEVIKSIITELFGKPSEEIADEVQNDFQGKPGEEVMIGLDAVALYPSISKEVATSVCRDAVRESIV